MIAAITPSTTVLTENHRSSPNIFLVDHMPAPADFKITVNHKKQYTKNTYIELFEKYNVDYKNKTLITDDYLLFEDFDNLQLAVEKNFFLLAAIEFNGLAVPRYDESVRYHLNFMSNKSRPHRILCATVIANIFSDNILYSYSSLDQQKVIADELLLDTNYNIDTARCLSDTFYNYRSTEKTKFGSREYHSSNASNFNFLYDKIFKNSATSIITEPCFFERGNMLTEKTLMAIYSHQFMIWPGTYKMAETAQDLGIDIFDDIIDHSYQYHDHPGKRVVEAFLLNKDFLQDLGQQEQLRVKFKSRLEANLKFAKDIKEIRRALTNLNSKLK